jgi:hypothetical protein
LNPGSVRLTIVKEKPQTMGTDTSNCP